MRKMTKSNNGKIFIISGPSGVGKSTVLSKALEEIVPYYFSISMTTRKPREGERDGRDYIFTDKETFEREIEREGFLEYVEYVGKYYGTPIKPIIDNIENGVDVFLDIEVVGRGNVVKKFPEAVSVFIMPPSLEELERRLRDRKSGESDDAISKRLARAEKEIEHAGEYDYIIVNDDVCRAAKELEEIITKEKSK